MYSHVNLAIAPTLSINPNIPSASCFQNMDQLFPIFGIALICAALLQFGLWTGRGLRLRRLDKRRFDVELDLLRAEIYKIRNPAKQTDPIGSTANTVTSEPSSVDAVTPTVGNSAAATSPSNPAAITEQPDETLPEGDWQGYRKFVVARLISETESCKSVYLLPEDGKKIVGYTPGQHLTLKLPVPGQAKPLVRCYTLSDAPNDDYYRFSVKRCLPPRDQPELPAGLASHFVNENMQEGDIVEVKSPSGTFHVQEGDGALVLLAGGIGITPMSSIINSIVQSGSKRECLLLYGVGNSKDHVYKEHLRVLAEKHSNLHIYTCYSSPLPEDQLNREYQIKGYVSVDILKQLLPNNNYDFYLCGPPGFMQSLYDGLTTWGVAEERIRYEAFGPATIKKKKASPDITPTVNDATVTFSQSQKTVAWNGDQPNLLDFIEEQGIEIDSGCRSGSCGTCQTRLLKGQVQYEEPDQIECEAGYCLPCMAKPQGAIEIDV